MPNPPRFAAIPHYNNKARRRPQKNENGGDCGTGTAFEEFNPNLIKK